jgi:hypothetical protein
MTRTLFERKRKAFERKMRIMVIAAFLLVWVALYGLLQALKQVDFKQVVIEAGQEIKQISHEIQEYQPE